MFADVPCDKIIKSSTNYKLYNSVIARNLEVVSSKHEIAGIEPHATSS